MVHFLGKRQDSKVSMSYGTSLCTLEPFSMSMHKSSVEELSRQKRKMGGVLADMQWGRVI